MTEDELKAVEDRASKATSGPWYWHQPNGFGADCVLRSKTDKTYSEYTYIAGRMSGFDNCDFIANSREDIPNLIKALREARGALAAQDERMRKAGEACGVKFEEHGCDWPEWAADALVSRNRLVREFLEACTTIRHEIKGFGQMGDDEKVKLLTLAIEKVKSDEQPVRESRIKAAVEILRSEIRKKSPPNEDGIGGSYEGDLEGIVQWLGEHR